MDDKYLPYIPRDDIYLFNTGNATKAWLCYGCVYIPELSAHRFIVWAPNARRVSLVGEFNGWNPDAMPMENDVCRAATCAMMSVPPVLPPARKTRPNPRPQTTPPHSEQSSKSPSPNTGRKGASTSVAAAETTMPKLVRMA